MVTQKSTAETEDSKSQYNLERGRYLESRIKRAVLWSCASKVSTFGLHILAFPVGIHALGLERFGIYVTLTALLGWVTVTELGIGPALTMSLAMNRTEEQLGRESMLFCTSFFVMAVIGSIVIASLLIIISVFPVQDLLGPQYVKSSGEMIAGIMTLGSLMAIQLILNIVPATRAGYQEVNLNYLWTVIGNGLSCIFIIIVAKAYPSVCGMILAVYGGQVLGNMGNGLILLSRDRPHLSRRLGTFDYSLAKWLISNGLAFTLVRASVFVHRQVSLLVLARFDGPVAVTTMAVMFQLVNLAQGIVVMLTQPLWPAIMDANSRADTRWIRKAFVKMGSISVAYSIIVALILSFAGDLIVKTWIGRDLSISAALQTATGVYFVLVIWTHVSYTVALGLGKPHFPASIMCLESLLGLILLLIIIPHMQTIGAPIALSIAMAAVTSWVFPLYIKRRLIRQAISQL